MQLSFDQRQQQILDKIRQRFEDNYVLDYCVDGVSIYVNKKIFNVKLHISIQYVAADVLILNINNTENFSMTMDGECLYLITIQDILNNLENQMKIYKEYIEGFISSLKEDDDYHNYLMDLVEGKLYLYGKVVVGPLLDINNDENYCTFFVNSLTGLYPMKRFTSLSYEDLIEDINFFL